MFGFNYFFKVCTHPLNRFHICIRRKKITYLLLGKKYCLKWISNRKMSRKSMDVGIHKWIEEHASIPKSMPRMRVQYYTVSGDPL